jgi:hypothetical protein
MTGRAAGRELRTSAARRSLSLLALLDDAVHRRGIHRRGRASTGVPRRRARTVVARSGARGCALTIVAYSGAKRHYRSWLGRRLWTSSPSRLAASLAGPGLECVRARRERQHLPCFSSRRRPVEESRRGHRAQGTPWPPSPGRHAGAHHCELEEGSTARRAGGGVPGRGATALLHRGRLPPPPSASARFEEDGWVKAAGGKWRGRGSVVTGEGIVAVVGRGGGREEAE